MSVRQESFRRYTAWIDSMDMLVDRTIEVYLVFWCGVCDVGCFYCLDPDHADGWYARELSQLEYVTAIAVWLAR